MGQNTRTGNRGFTFIEIMVVMAILTILVVLIVPLYHGSIDKAKEAVLKEDLFTLRDVIDRYASNHGSYPSSLNILVEKGYIRAIPVDPMTDSKESWVVVYQDDGVHDVKSASKAIGSNGVAYNQW